MGSLKRAAGIWTRGAEEISIGNDDLFILGTKYSNEKNFLNILISKESQVINTIHLTGVPTFRSLENYVNRALKDPKAIQPVGLSYLLSNLEQKDYFFRDTTNISSLEKYHLEIVYDEWFRMMDEFFEMDEDIYVSIIKSLKEEAYYDWEDIQTNYKHNNWPRNEKHPDFRVADHVYTQVLDRALFWHVVQSDSKNMERKLILDGKAGQRVGAEIHSADFFDMAEYYRQIAEICKAPKELMSRFIN